jgi:hypothetical protein
MESQAWWFMPVIPAAQEVKVGGSQLKTSGQKVQDSIKKQIKSKRAGGGGLAQVLEHLPRNMRS